MVLSAQLKARIITRRHNKQSPPQFAGFLGDAIMMALSKENPDRSMVGIFHGCARVSLTSLREVNDHKAAERHCENAGTF
jgi:hypothetical protein